MAVWEYAKAKKRTEELCGYTLSFIFVDKVQLLTTRRWIFPPAVQFN